MGITRILTDGLTRRPLKEQYWEWRAKLDQAVRLLERRNWEFAKIVAKNQLRFLCNTVKPIEGQTWDRARAAAAWLMRAHEATPDEGVSYGYFPCSDSLSWLASYPETTGYIIPTLLEFSRADRNAECRDRALQMARWEASIQMPSGAVQGGRLCAPQDQTPSAFNTGMVLDGWSAAYRSSRDLRFRDAGRQAANFLVGDLTQEGYFQTNGKFVSQTGIKTYNALCAWSLFRFGQDAEDERYQHAAIRIIEAAIKQQQSNGWFANNCLTRPEAPLSHTISYTLQGVLEIGILCGREDFICAAVSGVDPLVHALSNKGFLHGRYYSDWQPASLSSCLTGSAQLAIVCYRLYEYTGAAKYLTTANRLVDYLKALQLLDSSVEGANGALAGSFPIFGGYMTGGYPNWATKYFLDALMLQHKTGAAEFLKVRQLSNNGGGKRKKHPKTAQSANQI